MKVMTLISLIVLLTLNGLLVTYGFKLSSLPSRVHYSRCNRFLTELSLLQNHRTDKENDDDNNTLEPMFSLNYDPLELPHIVDKRNA